MIHTRRTLTASLRITALFVCLVAPAVHGRQDAAVAPAALPQAALTPAEMEQFLLKAEITRKRGTEKGVTNTIRATLSDGRITHDAQIQTVDIQQNVFQAGAKSELNFKDTYRYNIGAYRLSRLLGMTNVPMSVKRRVDGKDGSMTWWVDDVQFDEGGRLKQKPMQGPDPDRTAKQNAVRLVFDELIQNKDRNAGNLIWTKDWTLWLIDHTRAFRTGKDLMKPDQLNRVDRALLSAIRGLTLEAMTREMGDVMLKAELSAVIDRRDKLVKHFEDRIATVGEDHVLF
jgi:hypothetical protein